MPTADPIAAPPSPATGTGALPAIPLLDVGPDFAVETLRLEMQRAHRLLDSATRHVPRRALASLDAVSRRWLAKWDNAHLAEIDRVAEILQRPGAYFLSVNYEWGCTCRVAPAPDGRSARLVRVLDWRTPGLGENILAARVAGPAGPFVTLTWPGYTGVLQAVAPGRFAAALNQAPMRKAIGYYYLDWAANRRRVWHMPHDTPSHVLRRAFEQAGSYAEAKRLLIETPVSSPAIYSLAGTRAGDTCVIERRETDARVHEGAQCAANHWQAFGWHGHARGLDSGGRACRMAAVPTALESDFTWLKAPILNDRTRLVMIADATSGRFVAQGYEDGHPATQALHADSLR